MRVPRGFRDILPTEARELQAMRAALVTAFAAHGYVPLDPPMVEFADSAATVDERRMLRFLDRDGRLLALRPDITTAIARVAAQRYGGSEHALRLSYNNAVFREVQSMHGSEREYDQAGVELIGVPGLRADAEVIALLAVSLAACGLTKADLDIGHAGYLAGFLAELDAPSAEQAASLARAGDLLAALALFPAPRRAALERGLRFRGTDLAPLRADAPARSRAALDELARLVPLLAAAGVTGVRFDLGLVPALAYYSGVVFQVTAPGLGAPVAAGGRYDGLLATYGAGRPATGFGITLPHLHHALIDQGWKGPTSVTLVVLRPSADDAATLRAAAGLRALGLAVAIDEVAEAAGQTVVRAAVVDAANVSADGATLSLAAFAERVRRSA